MWLSWQTAPKPPEHFAYRKSSVVRKSTFPEYFWFVYAISKVSMGHGGVGGLTLLFCSIQNDCTIDQFTTWLESWDLMQALWLVLLSLTTWLHKASYMTYILTILCPSLVMMLQPITVCYSLRGLADANHTVLARFGQTLWNWSVLNFNLGRLRHCVEHKPLQPYFTKLLKLSWRLSYS